MTASTGSVPMATEGSGALGQQSVAQMLRSFLQVQQQRSSLYSQLAAGFKQYLETQALSYQILMNQITSGFQVCSNQVNELAGLLASPAVNHPELSALLRRAQGGERQKLHLTVGLQALRMAIAKREERREAMREQALSQAIPDSPSKERARLRAAAAAAVMGVDLPGTGITSALADVSLASGTPEAVQHSHGVHHHIHTAACGHGHGLEGDDSDDAEAPLATDEECVVAVQQSLLLIDRCVAGINDVIEEVRYALEDLEDPVQN
mmetsp:Transcript_21369/g.36417  ORF Transcript_21369/g.36417 Transcript_21369/m.36417 type:complete len:265 (+) Transcript_21369:305-1099(+)